jgi:hypothetical protein
LRGHLFVAILKFSGHLSSELVLGKLAGRQLSGKPLTPSRRRPVSVKKTGFRE